MHKKGLSLVELMMVTTIIVITSLMVAPNYMDYSNRMKLNSETQKVASHLRKLQRQSRENPNYRYGIEHAGSFPVSYDVGYWDVGAGSWNSTGETVTLENDLAFSGLVCLDYGTNSPYKIMFDRNGAPMSFDGWPQVTPLDSTCIVNIYSATLSRVLRIRIEKYTGRLRIN